MTQEQLADRIETAVRNVQRIESGTQNLTLLTVAKIASALGVQPEDLLGPAPVAGEPSRAKKSRS